MTEPFVFSNGQVAYNAQDLIELCRKFPDDSANYLLRGDFEKWLVYIGETKLAQLAIDSREASMQESQKLSAFTAKCQTVDQQPNIKPSQVKSTDNTDTAQKSTASPKVSLLAIFSQFLYNLLNNRGRKEQDELPVRQK